MTTQAEEARWAKLRAALDDRLTEWGVPYSENRARDIVRDLRRSGWRVPLPDFQIRTEPLGRRRALPPQIVRRHIQECREELRKVAAGE